ncbi:unknown [Proteobacteria bacterium CAG:495]|nr:unknown [Proteobacteria bacterium CAG:495]
MRMSNAETVGHILQFAVSRTNTRQTLVGMIAQNQFQHRPSHTDYFGIAGNHFHTFGCRSTARTQNSPVHLDNTHAAAGGRVNVGMFAQCRNVNLCLACRFQNGRTFGNFNFKIIYFQFYHDYLSSACLGVSTSFSKYSFSKKRKVESTGLGAV